MKKLLFCVLLIALSQQQCADWEATKVYAGTGECVNYGGCDYDNLWWTQLAPPPELLQNWDQHDATCVPVPVEVDHSNEYNCQATVWCGEESECCGGMSESAYCCDEGLICAEDGYISTKCVPKDTPQEELGCPFGYLLSSCTALSSSVNYDDALCQTDCVNAGYRSAHCNPEAGFAQECECGCVPMPHFNCPEPDALIEDQTKCYSIDVRATDEYCQTSCTTFGGIPAPACDPKVSDNDIHCWCWDCDSESESTASESESDSTPTDSETGDGDGAGSIETTNPGENCAVVTFYSECNYGGQSLEIHDDNDCLNWLPKSFCIPAGVEITLFDVCQYSGQNAIFGHNVECLDKLDIVSLLEEGVVISGQKKSLKVAQPKEFVQKFEIRKL